ncbi:hypothetical protein RJT34_00817 [Clitoria ternatea]|uniref:Uncharacterized protein n=1 Tax=Clitoria ternatea TaxID=43366 RepID=A0AAN9PY91_CLITE
MGHSVYIDSNSSTVPSIASLHIHHPFIKDSLSLSLSLLNNKNSINCFIPFGIITRLCMRMIRSKLHCNCMGL